MNTNTRRCFLKKSAAFGTGAVLGAVSLMGGCRCGCFGSAESAPAATGSDRDFSRLAYCGIDCDTCPLYKATIEEDDAAKLAAAEQWGAAQKPDFDLQEYYCYGCKDQRSCGSPGRGCQIRACTLKKGFAVCAQCRDFESCEQELWESYPQIRQKIRDLKTKLGVG